MKYNIRKLNVWLLENNFDVRTKRDREFYYDDFDQVIGVSVDKPSHHSQFQKFCMKNGLSKDVSWRTLCFLHELGHSETMGYESEFNHFLDKFKSVIETRSATQTIANIKCNLYYRLPIEKDATLWAIDYINSNNIAELEQILNEN